jgi:hypothetical protein
LQPCQGEGETLYHCEGKSETLHHCDGKSETLCHCEGESEALQSCERGSETVYRFEGESETLRDYGGVSETLQTCEGESETLPNYEGTSETLHSTSDFYNATNVQQIASDCVSDSSAGPTILKPEKVHLQLGLQIAEDGHISVKLNLFDKFSHKIYTGDGEVHIQNPTNEQCKMAGGV